MTRTFLFLLLSVPVLALACGAASAQTAAAPHTMTTHTTTTRETARRPPQPADNRPTGPFDNQLKKFSAPLSANGAK